MSDALLIGFAGVVLTLANVGFWCLMWASFAEIESLPVLYFFEVCTLVYGLIVPGAVMWKLAVRRSHTHDCYDLFKPSIITFVMLLLLFVLMIVFSVNVGVQFQIQIGPTVTGEGNSHWSSTTHTVIGVFLTQIVVSGMVFGFLGVGFLEGTSRLKKRLRY
jgi:hypothetical protein